MSFAFNFINKKDTKIKRFKVWKNSCWLTGKKKKREHQNRNYVITCSNKQTEEAAAVDLDICQCLCVCVCLYATRTYRYFKLFCFILFLEGFSYLNESKKTKMFDFLLLFKCRSLVSLFHASLAYLAKWFPHEWWFNVGHLFGFISDFDVMKN